MSKLLKLLDAVGPGNSAPIGFGAATQRERPAPLVCLGLLRGPHPDLETLVREGGLAGLLVVGDDRGLAGELGNLPVGVWPPSLDSDAVARYKEKGCDFLVGRPECVRVAALEEDDMAFFLALSPDLDDRLLRSLEELPVDGVILTGEDLNPPITLQHLMAVGAVRTMFGKHLLVAASPGLEKGDLEHLRALGVAGIAMELEGLSVGPLKELQRNIASMSRERRARRPGSGGPVPYIPPYQALPTDQEAEELEDELA